MRYGDIYLYKLLSISLEVVMNRISSIVLQSFPRSYCTQSFLKRYTIQVVLLPYHDIAAIPSIVTTYIPYLPLML